jgi:hypothetical protein
MTATFPDVLRHAGIANEAVGAMIRVAPAVLPGPTACDVLDELSGLASRLPPVFDKIASAMLESLSEFDMVEDDGADPVERNAESRAHLAAATDLAERMCIELGMARAAIARQKFQL